MLGKFEGLIEGTSQVEGVKTNQGRVREQGEK